MLYRIAVVLISCILMVASASNAQSQQQDRPNILWLTSEDNSPYLGCYGDPQAKTPNLDKLATQGVRYRHAFANAPVCSAARSTLITGMHACSTGIHNHRSSVEIPQNFELYPALLRKAGYYCTNNSKTDYNLEVNGKRGTKACWDECSGKAHYKNRASGQPFFAIFNTTISHEGQTTDKQYFGREKKGLFPKTRIVPPADVILPPYHADTPVIRENWSRYFNNMWLMDQWIGDMLQELDEAGLAEDTIVFYYSDHGGALPRGKRNIHDSGTRVPLIVRFPEKWKHLAPANDGKWCNDVVSFVDLPPTILSILNITIPDNYEGKAFLGKQTQKQDHVYLFRGRMDERYDTVRAIRTADYLYVNNFTPHRPWGQPYFYPFKVLASMGSWYDAYKDGACNATQARFWEPKPGEEFYVIKSDPHQINNSVTSRKHARMIRKLRAALRNRAIETRDTGFIPEGMAQWFQADQTLHTYAHSEDYPIADIYDLAVKATSRNDKHLEDLKAALANDHPVMRYWGATGCLILGEKAACPCVQVMLKRRLQDSAADVRAVAAEALARQGQAETVLPVLQNILKTGNEYEKLAAITVLEQLAQDGIVPIKTVRDLIEGVQITDLCERVMDNIKTLE